MVSKSDMYSILVLTIYLKSSDGDERLALISHCSTLNQVDWQKIWDC